VSGGEHIVARERIDLTQVCRRYKARVIQITPHDDYYLLETNRGPKELRLWPRIDVLRWSFAWREQLAREGIREVERFIRTRDAKPFVVAGRKGFTLTDHLRGAEPLDPSPANAGRCGRIVAKMHETQQANHLLDAAELLKKEQGFAVAETKRAQRMQQEFVTRHAFLRERDKWVASLFAPLLERMERSAELLSAARIDPDTLAVSHQQLEKENWVLVNNKVFLRGFHRPALSVQLRDVAGFLKQLYAESEDLERVDAFLDGYLSEKPLGYEDYKLLLAFMAFPQDTWNSVEQYVSNVLEERKEQTPNGIEQALVAQVRIDRLLQHIAHRAEEARSGASHEPL
jgi:Ser/Thr protein kinase RdoA (MazF antagonist)